MAAVERWSEQYILRVCKDRFTTDMSPQLLRGERTNHALRRLNRELRVDGKSRRANITRAEYDAINLLGVA